MVHRSALVLLGLSFVACGSFQETKIESADGGASESGASDGGAPDGNPSPGTFCATQDAGFCDDFDTATNLQPAWKKSSATGCDIKLDEARSFSAPRALHATCSSVAAPNRLALTNLALQRYLDVSFSMFLSGPSATRARLVSFTTEGRTFAFVATGAGLVAEIDVGTVPVTTMSFPFSKEFSLKAWARVHIEVFYDDKDGHVFVDVDDNRVVDASALFTYPHGQIPPANPLLFGAESGDAGGSFDVSFDNIVVQRARLVP